MNTSEQINELAAALSRAQAAMKSAPMSGKNPHLRNRYATLNDIIDTARKPLADNGLSYVQMPCNPDGIDVPFIGLATRIMHQSGQWLETTVYFPMDGGANKAVSAVQAAGSVLTYMRRYALASALGIVADEDADGNSPPARSNQEPPAAHPAAPDSQYDAHRAYADGSPVEVRAVEAYDAYLTAHDDKIPTSVHNLREWYKNHRNGTPAAAEQPALVTVEAGPRPGAEYQD